MTADTIIVPIIDFATTPIICIIHVICITPFLCAIPLSNIVLSTIPLSTIPLNPNLLQTDFPLLHCPYTPPALYIIMLKQLLPTPQLITQEPDILDRLPLHRQRLGRGLIMMPLPHQLLQSTILLQQSLI